MSERVIITDTVRLGIARYTKDQQWAAHSAMEKGCRNIENTAKRHLRWRNAPGAGLGGRATGRLANSLTHNVRSSSTVVEAEVGPGVKYAKWVEGQPVPNRHFVPFSVAPGLREWLKRHGVLTQSRKGGPVKPAYLGTGYVVGGEKSTTPFLEPAARMEIPRVLDDLARALRVGA